MTKLLVVLLTGLVLEAIGVVWLNRGLKEIGELTHVSVNEVLRMAGRAATNRYILQGTFFEMLFFGSLLYLMKHGDVSFIWPLTSLGFVLTTIAAKYVLHEQISGLRWFGVALIVAGAGVITFTEKSKEEALKKANPAVESSTTPQP